MRVALLILVLTTLCGCSGLTLSLKTNHKPHYPLKYLLTGTSCNVLTGYS